MKQKRSYRTSSRDLGFDYGCSLWGSSNEEEGESYVESGRGELGDEEGPDDITDD
jgi:hypothetical protein